MLGQISGHRPAVATAWAPRWIRKGKIFVVNTVSDVSINRQGKVPFISFKGGNYTSRSTTLTSN